MKGQISFAEFLVSLLIFVGFTFYIYFQLISFMPAYLFQISSERMKIEAWQISELLVNDLGNPINWGDGSIGPAQIKRVGLSDQNFNKTNYVSLTKANRLDVLCRNDYSQVKNWIDIDRQFSFLLLDKNTGNVIIDCKPPSAYTPRINATMNRFVAFSTGTNIGELIVQVW